MYSVLLCTVRTVLCIKDEEKTSQGFFKWKKYPSPLVALENIEIHPYGRLSRGKCSTVEHLEVQISDIVRLCLNAPMHRESV